MRITLTHSSKPSGSLPVPGKLSIEWMEAGRPREERENSSSCFITKAECMTQWSSQPSQQGRPPHPHVGRHLTFWAPLRAQPRDTQWWKMKAWEGGILLSAGTTRAASTVGSEGLAGRAET